jgi:hypothetical protein
MTMSEQKVVPLERSAPAPSVPDGATLGWIARVDDEGIWVETPDGVEPMLAMSVVALSRAELDAAVADRRDAVLLFLVGTGQPVLLGLCQPTPPVEGTLAEAPDEITAAIDGQDPRKVRLEGQDEVVLRCGKASITMRRNGRIVIRGVQVESRATGRNRIKGGAVLIN